MEPAAAGYCRTLHVGQVDINFFLRNTQQAGQVATPAGCLGQQVNHLLANRRHRKNIINRLMLYTEIFA